MTSASKLLVPAAAFALLGAAVAIRTRMVERRHPPAGKFIHCDGVRLHYLERGSAGAPPLVLLHGNGSMVQDFLASGLIDSFAERYRVLCFDRPGFGYSSRPRRQLWTPEAQAALVARALAELGVEKPIVLGHSWGTLVALALALRETDAVRGVVLISGYYFPTRRMDVWVSAFPALPLIGDLLRTTILPLCVRPVADAAVRATFAPLPVTPGFKAGFPVSLCLRPLPLRAAAEESAFMIPAARRLSSHYAELRCPVAVLAGTGDVIVEPEHAPRLRQLLPEASVDLVSGVGHMLHHAAPERVAAAVAHVLAAAP